MPNRTVARRAATRVVFIVGALIASTVGAPALAHADTFTPADSGPPFVSMVSVSSPIQPDAGASDTTYNLSATFGDPDTIADINNGTICLYHATEGDPTCATTNPVNTVKIVFNGGRPQFDAGGSPYWNIVGASMTGTNTDTTGTISIDFQVGQAMREGTWNIAITLTDISGNTGTGGTTTTVNHYAQITDRAQQDFGTLPTGSSATATDNPTVVANGPTTYTMTAGDFTDGNANSFTLHSGDSPFTAPNPGEITYDCNPSGAFDVFSATRIGATSTPIAAGQTPTGTPEPGTTMPNTCRLWSGGQRPTGTYTFTVINAVT